MVEKKLVILPTDRPTNQPTFTSIYFFTVSCGTFPGDSDHFIIIMDTLELIFSNAAHSLAALTSTSNTLADESKEQDYDDVINSDDDFKIDFSALLAASNAFAGVSGLATPTVPTSAAGLVNGATSSSGGSSSQGGNGRFPNSASRAEGTLGAAIRKMPGSRPDRGKFTILDGTEVAEPEEVLTVDFTTDLLQKIFSDPKLGIQFLARYGLIPNTRVCRVVDCPKDQLMSLIKHSNGFVWRCRSCRKRREKRIITKISVYEGTFLFYSRMPLNKFFIFMLIWCENAGLSITEYNRLMAENRLVEETIYNTIGFMRDIIQNWCDTIICSADPIGGPNQIVEIIETLSTEQLSNKTRNRRTRHYTTRTVFISLSDNQIKTADMQLHNVSDLERALTECVAPGSTVVMKDTFIDRFGPLDDLSNKFSNLYTIKTISDVWPELDEDERCRQYIKTEMNQVPNVQQEPYAYEYFFRRCFGDKCFNHLLRVIRLLYQK